MYELLYIIYTCCMYFTWYFVIYVTTIDKPHFSVDVEHGGVSLWIDLKDVKVEG